MQKLMSEVAEMILTLPNKIYISSANVDMRKSIDGLVSIVEDSFNCSSTDDALFVFHNKYCDKIKMLYWNTEGFCLLYKCVNVKMKMYKNADSKCTIMAKYFQIKYNLSGSD